MLDFILATSFLLIKIKSIMKRKRKGNGMSTTFAQNVVKGEDEIERWERKWQGYVNYGSWNVKDNSDMTKARIFFENVEKSSSKGNFMNRSQ